MTQYFQNHKLRTLAFILAIAITVMIAATAVTLAWVAYNKKDDANSIKMTINGKVYSITTLDCYPVTNISGNNYTFVDTPENYDFSLPTADPADLFDSIYKKAIILHFSILNNEYTDIDVYATTEQGWISKELLGPSGYEKENYLSNCVQFYYGTVSGNTFTKSGTAKTFVTGDLNNSPTKADELLIGNYGNETTDLYLVMEYNDSLLQYYYEPAISNPYEYVLYNNDIIFVIQEAQQQ